MPHAVTILLVEDEALIAMLLERQLRNLGCAQIRKEATGEAALASLETAGADLVLMDIHLAAELDGIQTARLMRQRHPALRIAFMTAYGTVALREAALSVQPVAFLEKPLARNDLGDLLALAAKD
jgi:CheY-like chemotaxis protein